MFLLVIGPKDVCLILNFFDKNSGNCWGQRQVIGKKVCFAVTSPVLQSYQ